MNRISAECLAQAVQDVPLPPGGALAFAPVMPAIANQLPEAVRHFAPRRQASFASGRMAARAALRRAGQADRAPGIGADGLPDWPRGWLGSISHSDDVAAALVAPDNRTLLLGLDIERLLTAEVATQIAPEVMPELDPDGSDLSLQVTRGFSAKEALYKALYPLTGQFREFSAAHICADQQRPDLITLALAEDWGADWPTGTRFEVFQRVAAGHVATILWRGAVG